MDDEDAACAWERYLMEKQRSRRRDGVLGACGLFLLILMLVSLMAARAWAGASSTACESIKDPDRRHYCRATTGSIPTECEAIRSSDLRAECRAILGSRRK